MLRSFFKLIFILFITCWSRGAKAQTESVHLFGTVKEPMDADIAIYKKSGTTAAACAEYHIRKGDKHFAFNIPLTAGATFTLRLTILKQGHMRLESEDQSVYVLPLQQGKTLNAVLEVSRLNNERKGSFKITEDSKEKAFTSIEGVIGNLKQGTSLPVSIQKAVQGALMPIQTCYTDKESQHFSLLIPEVEEGVYYLSTLRFRKKIYLKPGHPAYSLAIDNRMGDFSNMNAGEENQVLEQWKTLIRPITRYGYEIAVVDYGKVNLDSFTADYQTLQPAMAAFAGTHITGNPKFNAILPLITKLDNNLTALNLLFHLSGMRIRSMFMLPKEFNHVPALYQQLFRFNEIKTCALLQLGEGKEYLNLYARCDFGFLPEEQRKNMDNAGILERMMHAISNDTLKAYFLEGQLHQIEVNNYSEFRSVFYPQRKYTFVPVVKQAYDKVLSGFAPDTVYIGRTAYNFSLPDVKGKLVSMKDFKGKVVLIDVWATWCGPCKAQIPFLKKIEEDYKSNDHVVFVGISKDRPEDVQKWSDFITKEQMAGPQLLDGKGDFSRKYGLLAIPRFMLIDKKGNWIEVRCPLPENEKAFKKYLDEALSK